MPEKLPKNDPLTPEQKARIIECLQSAMSLTMAAKCADTNRRAIGRSVKMDKQFARDVKNAGAKGVFIAIKAIREARAYQAHVKFLERCHPKFFGADRDMYRGVEVMALLMDIADIARQHLPPEKHGEFSAAVKGLIRAMRPEGRDDSPLSDAD